MKKILIIVFVGFIGLVANAQIDRSQPPKPQPNPEINIKIPEVVTTKNGIKVIVVENHKLPKVSFQLYVDYPTIKEGDISGVSGIFGDMLGSGTENYSKDDFDAKVDYMGADVFTNARGFYASSLKKHTPELLGLLSEVIMKPAFPQDEFERIVEQTLSGLLQTKSDPGAMASNVASIVNYGKDHPYGEIMTQETVKNIKLEDVKSFYEKYFIPNYAYLVIVGDITQEEAIGYVDKYFGAWEKGEEVAQESFDVPEYEGNNVFFVDKPGAVQSQIKVTHTTQLLPGHEDVVKVSVMNKLLGGGGFSSHLMKNLREDKAYTYGCNSSISSDRHVATFSAGGSFRNEVTDSAVTQILYEIKWMTENFVTDAELDLAKASMTGAFARSLENPRTMAQFALNTVRYDLPKDYYTTYLKRLESVSKEDLKAMASKYLQPENLNIIIVGNEEVAEKQKVFDTSGEMEFKDAVGNEAVRLKEVAPDVTLESIFKKYVYKRLSVSNEAEYKKAMKKLGYIQTTYKASIEAMGVDIWMTTYKGKPNKTASIVKTTGAQAMVMSKENFNGEEGGTYIIMQGKKKYEGEELEEKKNGNFPFDQLFYLTDEKMNVELLGIDEQEGKEMYKIRVQEEGEEDFSFEYYDVKTGWLVMQETFTKDEEGNVVSGTILYEDYKELKKGFMIPHKTTIINPGQPVLKLELDNAAIGKKPKSKAFDGEFPK